MTPPPTPPALTPPPGPSIPPATTAQRSGLAVASLVLGIAGIGLCLGPLAGIPAVICGHKAQREIRTSGGNVSGGGLATAGLVTGYISIAMILLLGMMASIAIPNFVKARQQAMENSCRANRKALEGATAMWGLEHKKVKGTVPADSDLFGPDKYLVAKPVCPAGGIYQLGGVEELPACSIHGK